MAKGSSVQALYELCKKTFAPPGASPPPSAIRKLSSLLDTISPAEVGLKDGTLEDDRGHGFFGSDLLKNSARMARWAQPITYLHIYECDRFSIVRLAKLHADSILTAPCPTTVLYPQTGGNLHCFTAVTPCAVLDVLAPPYSEEAGRRCTYYHDYPYSSFSAVNSTVTDEDEYAWLETVDSPDNLYMRSGRYSGPAVQEEFCFPGSCAIA